MTRDAWTATQLRESRAPACGRVPLATPTLWLTCEGCKRGGEISVFSIPR